MADKRLVGRRQFLRDSMGAGVALTLAAVTPAAAYRRILGANDRVRLGFIGVGNRGSQLLEAFLRFPDAEVVALCDVYQPYLERDRSKVDARILASLGSLVPKMGESLPASVRRYRDFRQLLDQKDIDAVVIATPDHWHAVQTIWACEAGKDVYVEKPLTLTVVEGRRMVEVAKRTGRVVQVGLQRRSSVVYQEVVEIVRSGKIGKISVARAYRINNMWPAGIGREKPSDPPEGMDWDLWLGPRPYRPYQYNIAPYKFRWWKDYSSQLANWGVHYCDAIRWILGEEAPRAVVAVGGKFLVDDDRTIPDTLEVTYEMPSGTLVVFGQYEACGGRPFPFGEIELRGTLGTLYCDQSGYRIVPSPDGQFQKAEPRTEPVEKVGIEQDTTVDHVRNFLDCVKSRATPRCDLETGHRSNVFALLGNISLEVGQRIEWDAEREQVVRPKSANRFLHYRYRSPWKLS
ncbi:MAG: Gfo/Idh/MocA family oxidoreductase [candidate division KSB1 bacterium]|nr:Gfo/Idh/MocA family oxidoreductase [candidate division KSB1 bacterium]